MKLRSFPALIGLLLGLLLCSSLSAQVSPDQVVKKATIYFSFDKGSLVELKNYDTANDFIAWAKENSSAKIHITGWSDTAGRTKYNQALALERASTVRRFFEINGIEEQRITISAEGEDKLSPPSKARRAEVVATMTPSQIATRAEIESSPEDAPTPIESSPEDAPTQTEPTSQQSIELSSSPYNPGSLAIRTNLIYWVGGVANIGLEWQPADSRIGVLVNGGYGLLSSSNWEKSLGGWFVSPELRVYLGEPQAWFLGAQFITGEYDIKLGEMGREGSVIAGGLTAGYRIGITKCMDMDFSLGLGYGTLKYDSYHYDNNSNRYNSSTGNSITTLLPIQAGVSLIWKL